MKMKLFESLKLKFENPDWSRNPEFGLIDTILEKHPYLLEMVRPDITDGHKDSNFGRGDTPSVEQIMRAAIFKEMKGYDYRELEYAQTDSRICEHFVKINPARPYSFQMYHKFISKVSEETLSKLMVEINKIAIEDGIEDLTKFREDSTVVETNIHYPTNNSLVWDCINESHRLLTHIKKEMNDFEFENYRRAGKKTYYKINVAKTGEEKVDLFLNQLVLFTKCINQVTDIVKKKLEYGTSIKVIGLLLALERLLPLMNQVYRMTEDKEIIGKKVPNDEKIFSIYELHTDIIVKGRRECKFGHKVDIGTGASNLILSCTIPRGNPNDKELFRPTIDTIKKDYGITPESIVSDGGYASFANQKHAVDEGIRNVVFNKITRSMKNIAVDLFTEAKLMQWRSGIEAVISNLKRGYKLRRCTWKGWAHFQRKVYWSVIAYNIRVMTGHVLRQMAVKPEIA
jgi:IS5 family transposase